MVKIRYLLQRHVPEIAEAIRALPSGNALIDGEAGVH
jgi:hypothetical protein